MKYWRISLVGGPADGYKYKSLGLGAYTYVCLTGNTRAIYLWTDALDEKKKVAAGKYRRIERWHIKKQKWVQK